MRLRIIAELARGRVHVSELARRLGMSRPLLYMHIDRLEKAGLVTGHLELSEDGRAMKYYELAPFDLRLTAATIVDALRQDAAGSGDAVSSAMSASGDAASSAMSGSGGAASGDTAGSGMSGSGDIGGSGGNGSGVNGSDMSDTSGTEED